MSASSATEYTVRQRKTKVVRPVDTVVKRKLIVQTHSLLYSLKQRSCQGFFYAEVFDEPMEFSGTALTRRGTEAVRKHYRRFMSKWSFDTGWLRRLRLENHIRTCNQILFAPKMQNYFFGNFRITENINFRSVAMKGLKSSIRLCVWSESVFGRKNWFSIFFFAEC